jgi:glycosyl transferase, family 25
MSAFGFFDRTYCVHLPNASRRKLIEVQFERVGIRDVQYVHASQPPSSFKISNMRREPRAEFGANLSHIKAVVTAIADGAERPLFVEDDIVFHDDAERMLTAALADLPQDWHLLYIGGHPRAEVTRISPTLAKVGAFSFAEAYSLKRRALLEFFGMWCDRISRPDAMYDFVLGEFAAVHNAYCSYPLLCEQPPNMSQISGEIDDKRKLVARGWAKNLGPENVTAAHRKLSHA